MVKVTLKYTLLGRLWNICQRPWRTVGRGRSYMQGNSLRCEIGNEWRTWVLDPLWSKWCRIIHYWVDSEVSAKSHEKRLATDGDICRGIPSDAKLELQTLKHNGLLLRQFLHVTGQTEFQIYVIETPLKYMASTMTIAHPWTELQAEEFPQMRN